MNLIFLGPPGAGKGTMAKRLSVSMNLSHISTGDLFRAAIAAETDLGKTVKGILDSGKLVPDSITIEIVRQRLDSGNLESGFILDGFPRTVEQADALSHISDIDRVLNFRLTEYEIVRRLSGRRLCSKCGAGYHIEFMPPAREGICDRCGGELYKREDDGEESITTRLGVYTEQTEPLIDYYRQRGILIDIDASPEPDTVYANLLAALN